MPQPTDLKSFCAYLVQKYGDPNKLSEEQKAEEFRQVYLSQGPMDLSHVQVSAYLCGVGLFALPSSKFPRGMRGYNDIDAKGRKTIYYSKSDTHSGIQNTILHELREIMESVFSEISPEYQHLSQSAAHIAANRFATDVLLPPDDFQKNVYKTGLDVIALSSLYNKSCSQVLLRMKEVLDGKLAFCGSLYEPHPERPEHWVVTYSTSTTNHVKHNVGWLKIDGFYPSKGQTIKPRSIVDRTLSSGKSHIVSYHIMQGQEEKGSWLILAQPLFINEVVSKIAVVMLPAEEQNLLKTQTENVNPVQLEPISRFL